MGKGFTLEGIDGKDLATPFHQAFKRKVKHMLVRYDGKGDDSSLGSSRPEPSLFLGQSIHVVVTALINDAVRTAIHMHVSASFTVQA